jgi:hypothetical protein
MESSSRNKQICYTAGGNSYLSVKIGDLEDRQKEKVRSRSLGWMKRAPRGSGPIRFRLDVCADQAVAVRNFLIVISSFARNQSSWS